ncbi:MAG: tail fiber domain-containing protein [Ignavibacteria bacterium]|nr:tail fiber domain-containing protein [Ignavibacteria bacterium]
MKTKIIIFAIFNLLICNLLFGQSINGKLGTGGQFIIRDTNNTFLTLNQSTGELSLSRSLLLPVTTQNSQVGSIFKGTVRFLHNFSPTVSSNTFLGLNSGNFTMNGVGSQSSYNTGIGANTLSQLTTGYENSALGQSSMVSTTTGSGNSSFGSFSMFVNSTGLQNSAFGNHSMYANTTGNLNSGFGTNALYGNQTGFQNTAVGHSSLEMNTGNYNTALGYNSGSTITTGANLTCLGIDAAPTTPTALNQVTLGNTFVTSLRCNVQTITSLSDERDKKNITELSLGLDFITKLHPRQFNWDKREWYDDNVSDGSKMTEAPTAGFIAQELDEVQQTAGADWLNLVLKDNPEKWEATYGNLLPVMVKAIQELKAENDKLKDKLAKFEEMQIMLAGEISKMKYGNSSIKEIKMSEK